MILKANPNASDVSTDAIFNTIIIMLIRSDIIAGGHNPLHVSMVVSARLKGLLLLSHSGSQCFP